MITVLHGRFQTHDRAAAFSSGLASLFVADRCLWLSNADGGAIEVKGEDVRVALAQTKDTGYSLEWEISLLEALDALRGEVFTLIKCTIS